MASEVAAREREIQARHYGSGLAQWAMLIAPILAAFLQQQLAYMFVTWACTRRLIVLLHLPTLLALVIIVWCAVVAQRTRARVGTRSTGDERSSDARARFMASAALLVAAFATLLTIAQWLPTLFIHPCLR